MKQRVRDLFRILLVLVIFVMINSGEIRTAVRPSRQGDMGLGKFQSDLYILAGDTEQLLFSLIREDIPPQKPAIPANNRVEPAPKPEVVKGVYTTGWGAGVPSLLEDLLDFINQTGINTLVIEFKDDQGILSYLSDLPLAVEINAGRPKIKETAEFLRILKEHHIYPVARVCVFKDSVLAKSHPELAVRGPGGELFRDARGLAWVDPNSRMAWDYNIAIAREIAKMGFTEIQFDYLRYPDVKEGSCVYPDTGSKRKEDVIKDFLAYATQELKPLGVTVSVDTFGLVCSVPDGLGIGQQLEKIAEVTEIISPMVYPSHYSKGSYGLKDPDREPYETVYRSLADAQKRLAGSPARIRPWLQAFSLENSYGPDQISAQIMAAQDAGIDEWLFWNPAGKYRKRDFSVLTQKER